MFFSHRRSCCCIDGVGCSEGGLKYVFQCTSPCNSYFARCIDGPTSDFFAEFDCEDFSCGDGDGLGSVQPCEECITLLNIVPCNVCPGEGITGFYPIYKCVKCNYVETSSGPSPVLTGDAVCATAYYGITDGTTFGYGYWDTEFEAWLVNFDSATGGFGSLLGTSPCPENHPDPGINGTFWYAEYCGCTSCGPYQECG